MNLTSILDRLGPRRIVRVVVTCLMVAAAVWAGLRLWDHYELEPWTRDGRVRADIVQITPDVSGLVTSVTVQDNQRVHAGDLLFEVDTVRYRLAVREAEATLGMRRVTFEQAGRENARNADLGALVSQESREQSRTRYEQAGNDAAYAALAVEAAKLNLERAAVRAPSDGTVTNLDMRRGSYATTGRAVLAIVNSGSLYVEGYFEETKLPRIHVGDRVRVKPMGGERVLDGTVESFAAGIADRDRSTSPNLLPNVNPTFNWVRLPQRIPVRVHLDPLPADMVLVAGQTVTVDVIEDAHPDSNGRVSRAASPAVR